MIRLCLEQRVIKKDSLNGGRIMNGVETSMKKRRKCSNCKEHSHDVRTCEQRNKQSKTLLQSNICLISLKFLYISLFNLINEKIIGPHCHIGHTIASIFTVTLDKV
jgi:hypothetical protein